MIRKEKGKIEENDSDGEREGERKGSEKRGRKVERGIVRGSWGELFILHHDT